MSPRVFLAPGGTPCSARRLAGESDGAGTRRSLHRHLRHAVAVLVVVAPSVPRSRPLTRPGRPRDARRSRSSDGGDSGSRLLTATCRAGRASSLPRQACRRVSPGHHRVPTRMKLKPEPAAIRCTRSTPWVDRGRAQTTDALVQLFDTLHKLVSRRLPSPWRCGGRSP